MKIEVELKILIDDFENNEMQFGHSHQPVYFSPINSHARMLCFFFKLKYLIIELSLNNYSHLEEKLVLEYPLSFCVGKVIWKSNCKNNLRRFQTLMEYQIFIPLVDNNQPPSSHLRIRHSIRFISNYSDRSFQLATNFHGIFKF